jgi:hypothetical protein
MWGQEGDQIQEEPFRALDPSAEQKEELLQQTFLQIQVKYPVTSQKNAAHIQKVLTSHLRYNPTSSRFTAFYGLCGLGRLLDQCKPENTLGLQEKESFQAEQNNFKS